MIKQSNPSLSNFLCIFCEVIDCHQDWSGPCECLEPTFKKMWMDTEDCDNRLKFLTVRKNPLARWGGGEGKDMHEAVVKWSRTLNAYIVDLFYDLVFLHVLGTCFRRAFRVLAARLRASCLTIATSKSIQTGACLSSSSFG